MAHIPHNLYENLIKSVDGNTSLKVQVPIGVSAIGLEVDNLGSSRSAVNISGGDLDISDGAASISSDGVLKIFGLGTPNDADTESMLFQWNGTSSKFEIKASSSGTGVVRPIIIGDVLEINSGNILLSSIPTADPSVSGAIWSDNGVVVLSGSTASSGNPSSGIAGAIQFSNGSGGFSSDATNLFWNDTSNRLGIGTNSLSSTLNIGGDRTIYFIGGNGGINASTNILTVVAGTINLSTNNVRINNFDNGAMFNVQSDVSTRRAISIRAAASQTANLTEWQNSSGTVLTCVDEIGRIGVGTSSPSHPIHVSSTSNSTMFIQQVGTNDASIIFGNNSQNWSVGIDASASNALKFSASNDIGVGAKMTILPSGKVGINTVSPNALLEIADANEQFRIGYDSSKYAKITVNSSGNLYIDTTGGSVAVGELNAGGTNNFGKLEVIESNLAAEFNALSLYNSATQTIGNAVSLLFVASGNVGAGSGGVAKIQGVVANATVGSRQTDLAFFTDLQLSGQTEHMRITGTGRVGIGTTLPDAKFQVNTVSAATKGMIIKAAVSQAATLTEWQDSSGTAMLRVNNTGRLDVLSDGAIYFDNGHAYISEVAGVLNLYAANRVVLNSIMYLNNQYVYAADVGTGARSYANKVNNLEIDWRFQNQDSGGTWHDTLTLYRGGKVGIGQTSPGARLQVNTGGVATKGLIIQATASQTASLTEWQDSSGNPVASIGPTGNLTAGIAIFTSTTDAVGITIQGPSNTTTLLPRGDLKHTYGTENRYCLTSNAGVGAGVFGNDAGAIALGGGDVVGNINHGVVAGGAAGNRGELWFYGGADLTSPAVVIKSDGEVGIGTNDPGAKLEIETGAAATKGLIIQAAVTQTANLTEWQNSSGTVIAYVAADGSSSFSGTTTVSDLNIESLGTADSVTTTYNSENLTWNGSYWDGAAAQNTNAVVKLVAGVTENYFSITPDDRNAGEYQFYPDELVVPGNVLSNTIEATSTISSHTIGSLSILNNAVSNGSSITWQTQQITISTGTGYVLTLDNSGFYASSTTVNFGTAAKPWNTGFFNGNVGIGNTTLGAKLHINTTAAATIGQIIQGSASQTANLTEWQNSSGTVIAYVAADGSSSFSGTTTVSDLNIESLGTADSITTTYNSENLTWNGSYWDGAAAQNTNAVVKLVTGVTENYFSITPDDRNAGEYQFYPDELIVPGAIAITSATISPSAGDWITLSSANHPDINEDYYIRPAIVGSLSRDYLAIGCDSATYHSITFAPDGRVGFGSSEPLSSKALVEIEHATITPQMTIRNGNDAMHFTVTDHHPKIILDTDGTNRHATYNIAVLGTSYWTAGMHGNTDYQLRNNAGTTVLTIAQTTGAATFVNSVSAIAASLISNVAANIPLTVQGAASQTANLTEWKNSSGTVMAYVAADGSTSWKSSSSGTAHSFESSGSSTIARFSRGGTPQIILDVDSNDYVYGKFITNNAARNTGITFGNSIDAKYWTIQNDSRDTSNSLIIGTSSTLTDSTNFNAAVMTLQQDGKVGIGTNSPATKLDVAGDINLSGGDSSIYFDGAHARIHENAGDLDLHSFTDNAEIRLYGNTLVKAGSAAIPGLAFIPNPTTGIFQPVFNTLAIAVAGVESVRIINGGNVGIGETVPGAKLQVNTVSAATKGMIIKAAASQSANLTEWQNSSGTVVAYVAADGSSSFGGTTTVTDLNISALGTADSTTTTYNSENLTWNGSYWDGAAAENTNAVVKLVTGVTENYFSVTPDDRNAGEYKFYFDEFVTPGDITVFGATFQPRLSSSNTLKIDYTPSTNNPRIDMPQNGDWSLARGGSDRVRFFSDWSQFYGENLFVASSVSDIPVIARAVASHTANLTEWQDSSGTVLASVNKDGNILLSAATPTLYLGDDSDQYIRGNATSNYMMFFTGNTEKVRIDSSGKVGIGITAPDKALHISHATVPTLKLTIPSLGETATDGLELLMDVGANAYLWNRENGTLQFGTNNLERVKIDSSGYVGIGGTPTAKLSVIDGTGALHFSNTSQSNLYVTGTNASLVLDSLSGSNFPSIFIKTAGVIDGQIATMYPSTGINIRGGSSAGVRGVYVQASGVGIGENAPGAQLHVTTISAATKGLIVKGAASQTAYLTEWQNSSGTRLASVDPSGHAYFSSGVMSTDANGLHLNGSSVYLHSVNAGNDIRSSGHLNAGYGCWVRTASVGDRKTGIDAGTGLMEFWHNGTVYAYLNTNIFEQRNSTSAQTYRLYGYYAGGGDYHRLSMSYDGSTRYTIKSENATSAAQNLRLESAKDLELYSANARSVSIKTQSGNSGDFRCNAFNEWTMTADTATRVPLTIQGVASQSGNLQEWENSSGVTLTSVGASGTIGVYTGGALFDGFDTSSNQKFRLSLSGNGVLLNATNAAGMFRFLINSVEKVRVDSDGNVGIGATAPGAKLEIETGVAATKGLIVQAAASQTANLTEWQNDSGTVLSYVDANGQIHANGVSLPLSTKTANYTVTILDHVIIADATTAGFNITLPDPTTCSGQQFIIKKKDATTNAVTVLPNSTETIDGEAVCVIDEQWVSNTFISDGANWLLI